MSSFECNSTHSQKNTYCIQGNVTCFMHLIMLHIRKSVSSWAVVLFLRNLLGLVELYTSWSSSNKWVRYLLVFDIFILRVTVCICLKLSQRRNGTEKERRFLIYCVFNLSEMMVRFRAWICLWASIKQINNSLGWIINDYFILYSQRCDYLDECSRMATLASLRRATMGRWRAVVDAANDVRRFRPTWKVQHSFADPEELPLWGLQ